MPRGKRSGWGRVGLALMLAIAMGCGSQPPPVEPAPTADPAPSTFLAATPLDGQQQATSSADPVIGAPTTHAPVIGAPTGGPPPGGGPVVRVAAPGPAPGGSPFGQAEPSLGTLAVATGFLPDPQVVEGQAGGAVDARAIQGQCAGFIPQAPHFVIETTTPFAFLRIAVGSRGEDSTLVVQRADGSVLCNDDAQGLEPMVEGSFPVGRHRVWVGTYSQGARFPFRLGVSELRNFTNASLSDGPPPGPPPETPGGMEVANFAVRAGFTPDPLVYAGTAGGAVDASEWSAGCAGFVSAEPTHVLHATSRFPLLRLVVTSNVDTTLVVRRPDGTYVCNDDSEGLNPALDLQGVEEGAYKIWIGTYTQGQRGPYALGVSQRAQTRVADLHASGG